MVEGGPRFAGTMIGLGIVDEFFLTMSPRVIAGESARVVHGPEADPVIWALRHGFVDDEGFSVPALRAACPDRAKWRPASR